MDLFEEIKNDYKVATEASNSFYDKVATYCQSLLTKNGNHSIDFGGIPGIKAYDHEGKLIGEVSWLRNSTPFMGIELSEDDENYRGFPLRYFHPLTLINAVESLHAMENFIGEE